MRKPKKQKQPLSQQLWDSSATQFLEAANFALRFFFRVTLNRPEMCRHLTMVQQSQKLPTVLSKEDVLQRRSTWNLMPAAREECDRH